LLCLFFFFSETKQFFLMVHYDIYTDGACRGNPGVGGWGVFWSTAQTSKEASGGEPQTTNNRMELTAAIEALRMISLLEPPTTATLHTDSTYVYRGITEWIKGWKTRGWQNSKKQPVLNKDLWVTLDHLVTTCRIPLEWKWVKAHNGNPGNEKADALANHGIDTLLRMKKN
jgi:ribonuclease HI